MIPDEPEKPSKSENYKTSNVSKEILSMSSPLEIGKMNDEDQNHMHKGVNKNSVKDLGPDTSQSHLARKTKKENLLVGRSGFKRTSSQKLPEPLLEAVKDDDEETLAKMASEVRKHLETLYALLSCSAGANFDAVFLREWTEGLNVRAAQPGQDSQGKRKN